MDRFTAETPVCQSSVSQSDGIGTAQPGRVVSTPHLPDVVVFPESREDVSRILQFANSREIPVIPFGLGSSLEGHVIPYRGGISIDFQRMNRILEVRPEDMLVRVQPGVTRTQLNKELKKYGLFFSVDPGADATLGGMAATNASGTTAIRYGVMRDQVRDLEVVLADGRIIRTGGRAAKSSSGYHLTGLFVGSEGTLGVFTELTLRVFGIPEAIMAARAVFPTVEQAVNAAVAIISSGIPVARIELVDALSMKYMNEHSETCYPVAPTLFLEFHGNEEGLKRTLPSPKSWQRAKRVRVFSSKPTRRPGRSCGNPATSWLTPLFTGHPAKS